MNQDLSTKKYPATTPEVARMLKLDTQNSSLNHQEATTVVPLADLPVADLPVAPAKPTGAAAAPDVLSQVVGTIVPDAGQTVSHGQTSQPDGFSQVVGNLYVKNPASGENAPALTTQADSVNKDIMQTLNQFTSTNPFMKAFKIIAPYVIVFTIGIFAYYYFFSSVNFGALFQTQPIEAAPQVSAVTQLEQQDLTGYYAWISGYYYDVSDPRIIDPETDNSGDGLSNFEKYLLNLNPKSYDTLGLGMPDSQAIAQGINPLSGTALTDNQKAIIAKYIDMEVVMNRLALHNMQSSAESQVAGASIGINKGTATNISPRGGTVFAPAAEAVPNPAAGSSLGTDYSVNVNTTIPGRLEIPDLKISVPVIWTQDQNNFETDLQAGVVHYPGTAMPGQIGTAYIAGHSSNYAWAKGSYNRIFSTLGSLPNGSSFQLTLTDKSGQQVTYHYVTINKQQYSPTDQAQFANTGKSIVALSTCWPVGSTAKRMVVFGQLTQVEK